MPDFSDPTAKHPDAAPDTSTFDKTHDKVADRDSATPTEYGGGHAERAHNEIVALSVDIREALGLRVRDNGGIEVKWNAGRARFGDGASVDVAAGTLGLTDDQTNYVEVNSSGTVSKNTTAFTGGRIPMATVVCASGDISSVTDDRTAYHTSDYGAVVLNDIGDVTIDAPADNEVLAYDGVSDFTNQTPTEAGLLASDGSVGLSSDWDAGSHKVTAEQLESDIATGTAPLVIASETMVDNLNADMVDGVEEAAFLLAAGTRDLTKLVFNGATELTIDTGSVTRTQTVHKIDTEGDNGTDDLDTIAGGADGDITLVRAEHADRTIVLKHGTGNLELAGADVTLDDTDQAVILYYDGTLSKHLIIGGSGGGGAHTFDSATHSDVAAIVEAQGQVIIRTAAAWDALAVGVDGQFLKTQGAAADPVWADAPGAKADALFDFPAGSWDYPSADPAPLDTDVGANGDIKRHLFDDTTEEFVVGQIEVPADLNAGGTVTFVAYGYPTTAAADDIVLRFHHCAKATAEVWDAAYVVEESAAKTCSAVQDTLGRFTWTETVGNLGWAASDQVRIMVSRDAGDGNDDLTGDWGMTHFRIIVPRT